MKMRAAQVTRPTGPLDIVEREIPEPAPGQVRVKIEACGICHSDAMTKEGLWPGIHIRGCRDMRLPASSMHSAQASPDGKGQRVGVGWHGGHCGYCDSCRRGDFVDCQVAPQITGYHLRRRLCGLHDRACRRAGDDARWSFTIDAAPLMCAGVTTFNPLRNSGARPGDLVAILGIGGLGHLGVQFAAKMGFKTVAHRSRQGQGAACEKTRCNFVTSTRTIKTPRPSWSSWAARKSSLPPRLAVRP